MKIFTTALTKPYSSFSLLWVLCSMFLFTSVSCAETPTDSLNKDSHKYLSYYETIEGERIHWEVNFFGDEITSIYKNGKRIPDDFVSDYKDKVYDQLDEMRFGSKHFSWRMPVRLVEDFHIDMEGLRKDMEELNKDLPECEEHLKFYKFDDEQFKKDMEELQKELRELNLDKFKNEFDKEKFEKQMKELEKNLKENLPKPEDFHFYFKWEEEDSTEV